MFELGTDGPSVILAGIDGSQSSLRAAAYAAGLARRQGSLLVVAFMQSYGVTGSPEAAAASAELGRQLAEDLEKQLREAAARVPEAAHLRWEFHTRRGDPYNGLVELAKELRADAVVIGASEKAGHRILGSVAIRLVKAGRWPVTVVP
ncbi:MAG TPA: universal stress protein [Actinospica sp.]|jgi:nucleotide-binding universal stress UspA family protein|nr:universal stress protein [Actinospica sp.]